ETNFERLFGVASTSRYVKDAFHRYVIDGDVDAVRGDAGTKAAFHSSYRIQAGDSVTVRLRLTREEERGDDPFGAGFDATFATRIAEADAFYHARIVSTSPEDRLIARQAYAGLLWSKQFYHYAVREWLEGDPAYPPPPENRWR